MKDPFAVCGSIREKRPNPYRCDQPVGHLGPHSAAIPVGVTPTLHITSWQVAEFDNLETAGGLLATAIGRMNSALDDLSPDVAAAHISPKAPMEIELLAARLRRILGDVAD